MHVPRRTMAVVITLMISAILLVLLAVYQGVLGDKEKYTFPSVTDYFDPNGRLAIDGKINDLICEKSEVTGLLRSHPVVQAMTLEPFPIYPVDPAERLSIERRDSQFSIIVNTYKRHEALKTFLRTYEGCPNLHTIHVIWNESLEVPERATWDPAMFSDKVDVVYHGMPTSSFNNRFLPIPGVKTDAILSIDDDILTSCDNIQDAFEVTLPAGFWKCLDMQEWQRHPRQLVGFFPRHYWVRWDEGAGVCRHGYKVLGFSPKELYGREFSIILTKGCFMHRDWLAVYTERLPQGIKDHVEQNRNCEDIAMQFLVAGVTGEAPRLVARPGIRDEGARGGKFMKSAVSVAGNHYKERSRCVETFVREMGGRNPLVTADPLDAEMKRR